MNDFEPIEGQLVAADSNSMVLIDRGEIDMQIATAHRFPRSIAQFRRDVQDMVTISEQVAQECIYSLPRDGKVISGPSARFAEIVVSAWGNVRAATRIVSQDDEFITAQAVFHDLQRNVAIAYQVPRRITNSQGKKFKADMIAVTANAASSIALRNAILKGVPKAFWAEMFDGARLCAMGDVKTLPNRRAEAFGMFQHYGITKEQIYARLGVHGEADIGQEYLVVLRGIITAIKDGDTTPEQAFDIGAAAVVQKVKAVEPAKPEQPAQAAASPDEPADKAPEAPAQVVPVGMARVLLARMKASSKTEDDLRAKFGYGLEGVTVANINELMEWARSE